MDKLKQALRTLVYLLKSGPLGRDKVVFDDHSLRATGRDGD